MLVRVGLDCEALQDRSRDVAQRLRDHRVLIEQLLRHGVIRVGKHELHNAITGLCDNNVSALWAGAISRIRFDRSGVPPPACLCEIGDASQFRASWRGQADVAIVDPQRALELGVPDTEATTRDSATGIEIVRFDLTTEAETFRQLESVGERGIETGEERKTLWSARFRPLAKHSLHITICDRYAGVQLRHHYETPKTHPESGLRWFLRALKDCGKSYVHLIVGAEHGQEHATVAAVEKLLHTLPASGVADLKLTVVPDRDFKRIAHDRHIRFENISLSIGRGMTIFEEVVQSQGTSCQYRDDAGLQSTERKLCGSADKAGWPSRRILRAA